MAPECSAKSALRLGSALGGAIRAEAVGGAFPEEKRLRHVLLFHSRLRHPPTLRLPNPTYESFHDGRTRNQDPHVAPSTGQAPPQKPNHPTQVPPRPPARTCRQPCARNAGGYGPALLAGPPGHKARTGLQEQGPVGRRQRAAGAQRRAREQRGSAAARARSPPTPASRSLLLRALSVTPAVPSPGSLRPSPSSRRARGQEIGLVTSSTAALSTEWTPLRPVSPRHRPRPRAPGSALRPRLAGPRAPGPPRSPIPAALRLALPAAAR